ncbi:hypothetical protein F4777DRAFT_301158 [Nemania sp. FL0916]|nr:hypothetical protein F4777DRAFT_301158 [Nemania sp. FL0916]
MRPGGAMSRLLTTATLVAVAQALAFENRPARAMARATDAVVPDTTFSHPAITPGPILRDYLRRDTDDETILIGPDNTCGYVDGRAGAPITCNSAYTCAIAIEPTFGRAGCCLGDACGIRATCYDYRQVYSSSLCNDGCLQDTYTLKCTETTAAYCNTITFFSGVIDFFCASLSISTPQQLYTTYAGEVGARAWSTFVVTPSTTGTGVTGFGTATNGNGDGFSFTSPAPINTELPGSGGSSNGGSGNGGSSNNNGGSNNGGTGSSGSSLPSGKTKKTTPIGAIVGGVVGGVGGLSLLAGVIFFFIRRNKKQQSPAAPTNPEQPMQQTGPPPTGGMPPNANGGQQGYPPQQGYDPNGQQQAYGYQQGQQGQGYYPGQEHKPGGFVGITAAGVPDRHDSTSPVSQFSDPRLSTQPPPSTQSPTSTQGVNHWGQASPPLGSPPIGGAAGGGVAQTQTQTLHEADSNVVGQLDYNAVHHGQIHEMHG